MANTPLIISGAETGDMSESSLALAAGTGAVAVDNTLHAGNGAYSYHVSSGGDSAAIHFAPWASDGSHPNTGWSQSKLFLRFDLYLASATAQTLVTLTGLGTLDIVSGGNLHWKPGDTTFTFPMSTALSATTWYRLDVTADSTGQTWEVRLNGTVLGNGGTTSVSACNGLYFGDPSGSIFDFHFDNVWLDSSAYAPNSGSIACFTPKNPGFYAGWSDQPNNLVPPNTTKNISSATNNDTRTVTTNAALASSYVVNAVQPVTLVNGIASANVANVLRSNTTNVLTGGKTVSVWTALGQVSATDPATSSAWTAGGTNAAQPGVKHLSSGDTALCESVYLMVDYAIQPPTTVGGCLVSGALRPLLPKTVGSCIVAGVAVIPQQAAGTPLRPGACLVGGKALKPQGAAVAPARPASVLVSGALRSRAATTQRTPGGILCGGVPSLLGVAVNARARPASVLAAGPAIHPTIAASTPRTPGNVIAAGVATIIGATSLAASAPARPGAVLCGGVFRLPVAHASAAGNGLRFLRGPYPPPSGLPEGQPCECGLVLPDGSVLELLYLGGHDGNNKLVGGGMQLTNGMPAWTPPTAGITLFDGTTGLLWISKANGTWVSK